MSVLTVISEMRLTTFPFSFSLAHRPFSLSSPQAVLSVSLEPNIVQPSMPEMENGNDPSSGSESNLATSNSNLLTLS